MTDLPAPLVPVDTDLRDFPFMPVDIVRLFGSEFHTSATDSEWRAGVTLWLKSFHQVPAASLPADDASLCRLAELGRDVKAWRKVKTGALRGWVLCEDGRYYHRVVAEKALEAWIEKLTQRKASAAGNAKKYKRPFDPAPFDLEIKGACELLAVLAPESRVLRKRLPVVSHREPDGSPEDLTVGSQETGTGTEITANEQQPSQSAAAALPSVDVGEIERRCVEATDWTRTQGISAIVDLVRFGGDFEGRILPMLRTLARERRDRGQKPPDVWAWAVKAILDPSRRPDVALTPAAAVWVGLDSPGWEALIAGGKRESYLRSMLKTAGDGSEGIWVPAEWLAGRAAA